MEETQPKKRRRRSESPPKKRGPKSPYSPSLGIGVKPGLKMPKAVAALFKLWDFKRLLNWMALNEPFRKKILDQVPEHDPPEPEKPLS